MILVCAEFSVFHSRSNIVFLLPLHLGLIWRSFLQQTDILKILSELWSNEACHWNSFYFTLIG